jgi:hypothetical protein
MVNTQCEQIAKTQTLILKQKDLRRTILTNFVTRGGVVVQGPTGPDWLGLVRGRTIAKVKGFPRNESGRRELG